MSVAPQHDWSYVEARSRESDAERLRGLMPAERFAVYADLYNSLWLARQKLPGDWQRLDERRWEEKLALRRRFVEAFQTFDGLRSD